MKEKTKRPLDISDLLIETCFGLLASSEIEFGFVHNLGAVRVRFRCGDCRYLFVAQRLQRIDLPGAPHGRPTRQEPNRHE